MGESHHSPATSYSPATSRRPATPRLSACNCCAFSTFLALFNVFSYDAGIVALSVWPAWLVVVALTLAPWIFNPGAHQTLNSVLSCAREWLLWLHNSQDNDKWPGKGKYEAWHTNRMALLRGAPWHVKAWRLSLSASIRGSLVLAGAVAMRKSPALLAQPPHAALVVVASASAVALVLAFPYHALHRLGVALLRACGRSTAWSVYAPVVYVVALQTATVLVWAGVLVPSALKMQAPALCGCGEIVCSVADGGVAWCGLLGPYADGQPLALAVALIGGASLLSWLVQAAGYLGWSAPKPGERVGPCRRVGLVVCGGVRGWSDFWYARLDATVGGVILVALFALSFLPLSYLQSIVLYNRNFGVIIRNKLRRAEFLDSLLA